MRGIEKSVFISYRRTDLPWALAVYQYLTHRGYDVFFDFTNIDSGNFEKIIIENIHARAHFILLLTPTTLERCDDPKDLLRREIETALEARRNIIPILVEGFDFDNPDHAQNLIGTLENLRQYNALHIPEGYFDEAMERLSNRFLNVKLEAVLHPVSNFTHEAVIEQQALAISAIPVMENIHPSTRGEKGPEKSKHHIEDRDRLERDTIQLRSDRVFDSPEMKSEFGRVSPADESSNMEFSDPSWPFNQEESDRPIEDSRSEDPTSQIPDDAPPPKAEYMSELIGKTLGKYRIEALIGSGGMAQVFKAYHPGLDRYVAIKALHRYLATESDYVTRFKREAEAVAILRHPNIVRVYDFDSEGDILYMVMELIQGPTLKDVLHDRQAKGEEFSIDEIAEIFSDLANAMDYAHQRNIIHRDLKPANIMFTQEGQCVITDFGISRILGATRHTLPGSITGTPDYMSPETCRGEGGNKASDIYSLGVILYQIVTGQVPFEADTPMSVLLQHISSPIPPPSSVNPKTPKRLEQIILKAMHKAPAERYQSAGELAQAIRDIVGLAPLKTTELRPVSEPSTTNMITEPPTIRNRTIHLSATPFQVPRDISHFVGRQAEIDQISTKLLQPQKQNIYCLVGMAGVGKTALAVHIAHSLRAKFSDGILWASVSLSQPLAILDSWAQVLGLDFSHLPDVASRSAALRSELVDKNILILLDDVATPNSIDCLLPGSSKSMVLITTRNSDLPIAIGADQIELQTLTVDACQNLIKNILGEARLAKETEEAITDLVEILGGLPLAVEIAAQRLASRPRWRVNSLVQRLHNRQNQLDELVMSDLAVRASFAISWDALGKQQQRILALLGVFDGRAFETSALASTAEISQDQAEDYLHALRALSLVKERGDEHYQQHPLLASFSKERLGPDDKAFSRMARYYLLYAQQHRDDYLGLEEEVDNLTESMRITYQQKMYAEVLSFCNSLEKAWFARGRFSEARRLYPWACEASEVLDLPLATAKNYRMWAQACIEQGDYDEAIEHLEHSLKIGEQIRELGEIARVKYALGRIAIERANYENAEKHLKISQHHFESIGDVHGYAHSLHRLANIPFKVGNYTESMRLGKQALKIQLAARDKFGAVLSFNLIADCELQAGDYFAAKKSCQCAIKFCREIQEQGELATTYATLSKVYRRQNNLLQARRTANRSLALFRRMGDRRSQALALYQLLIIDKSLGAYKTALDEGQLCIQLLKEIGNDFDQVYVLYQIGDVLALNDQPGVACQTWRDALAITESFEEHQMQAFLHRKLAEHCQK